MSKRLAKSGAEKSSSIAATAPPRKLDLSRIRHDLRTPINHILGYCEMLLEEESVPRSFIADLEKIHTGGRQLVALINEYFDDETFATKTRDLHQLCHELRTPVNHIIGYSEILQEQAEDIGRKKFIPDLKKIHQAATMWLALMEEYLIAPNSGGTPGNVSVESTPTLNQGVGFQAPSARGGVVLHGSLLLVDDDEGNREMLARRLRHDGHTVTLAANGLEALQLVRAQPFDLVLLDLIMPGLDGYQVLSKMKADAALRDIPVIMISALDQENGVARCIELGAEDYLAKPFNPVFLRARLGASLEKRRLREQERATFTALQESQKRLVAELAEAAEYVRSLLPKPIGARTSGPRGDDADLKLADKMSALQADWRFIPSTELGGDVLSYHWLDDDHFAAFIVDVCGHGMTAAIFSITILNVLRSQALPETDFRDPAAVLTRLNERFPMDRQNNMYFTIWYGVFNRRTRELTYASGGHPPAVLLDPTAPASSLQLRTPGAIIGYLPEAKYSNARRTVPLGATLFVFSDGAYEISRGGGATLSLQDLVSQLETLPDPKLDSLIAWASQMRGSSSFEDDLSVVELKFA